MIAYILPMMSEIVFSVELNRSPVVTIGKGENDHRLNQLSINKLVQEHVKRSY